jgi:hypothetical protein
MASKAVWLDAVEASDEAGAIEKAAAEFGVSVKRLNSMQIAQQR